MKRLVPLLMFATLIGAVASACGNSGEEERPTGIVAGGGHGGALPGIELGSCEGDESNERECTIYITQASGVTSCFQGIQYCSDGTWTECLDPDHDPRVQ